MFRHATISGNVPVKIHLMLNSGQYGIAQMIEQVVESVVFLRAIEIYLDSSTIQRCTCEK